MTHGAATVADRKKADEGASDRPVYVSVKIEAEVYRLIRTVAAWRGTNIADYLTEIARSPALRDFAKMQREQPPADD